MTKAAIVRQRTLFFYGLIGVVTLLAFLFYFYGQNPAITKQIAQPAHANTFAQKECAVYASGPEVKEFLPAPNLTQKDCTVLYTQAYKVCQTVYPHQKGRLQQCARHYFARHLNRLQKTY